mgnify:CR=1 FL=1
MGTLRVTATQSGARVWLDDQPAGTAPVVRQVPVGAHRVRVSADDFNPFVARVDVKKGQTEVVQARMFPGGGTVEFAVNAPGGKVVINGATELQLPTRLSTVQPGNYRYTVSAPGFESQEGRFTFARGKNLYLYSELERSAGLLVVDTVPAAQVVRLDGQVLGPGPIRRDDLAPGPHLVEVEVDGHARMVRAVDTSDGSKLEVSGRVPKRGGTAKLNTRQADAAVTMSGVHMADGRSFVLDDVARGRYNIEVTAPGYRTAKGRLVVDEGRRSAYKVDWAKEGERARSQLIELPPWYARWQTWTIAGGTVAIGITSAALIAKARQPEPISAADTTVTLP